MATIAEALALALDHHRAGRLAEAETLYGRILDAVPDQPDALHLAGILAGQTGRAEQGAGLIAQAMALRPDAADYPSNLGALLDAAGQPARAAAACRRALAYRPDFAAAWGRLGVVVHRLGDDAGALAALTRAAALDPDDRASAGRAALLLHQRAIGERSEGRVAQARATLAHALRLAPENAGLRFDAGHAAHHDGDGNAAFTAFQQTLALSPDHPEAWANLGALLEQRGRMADARTVCRRALALEAGLVTGWVNRAAACEGLGRHAESADSSRRALALDPAHGGALGNLATALRAWGRVAEGLPLLRRAVALGDPTAERSLLAAILYDPSFDEEARFAEAAAFAARRAATIMANAAAARTDPQPDRRLRIGYLTSDFRAHPIARNMEPILANHDHQRFEIAIYADTARADALTDRLRGHADLWRPIDGLSDAAVAALIRADAVDVLVILGGRFDANRPLVAAHRPAPVQISAHDGGTSGLPTVDALLTDRVQAPRGGAERFSERPFRLPSFYAFQPIADAPPPALPDAGEPLTFGSLNNPAKLNDAVLALWARALAAVPGARLLLKYKTLYEDEGLRDRLRGAMARGGGDPDRLLFPGPPPEGRHHLSLYHRIHIGLDSLPFTGATTSFEALWMGVPVVTLPGSNLMGRVSAAHLTAAGAPELIAADPDDWVRVVARLAADRDRIAAYRAGLPDRLRASPILDGRRKARQYERAYRALWRRWCARQTATA